MREPDEHIVHNAYAYCLDLIPKKYSEEARRHWEVHFFDKFARLGADRRSQHIAALYANEKMGFDIPMTDERYLI